MSVLQRTLLVIGVTSILRSHVDSILAWKHVHQSASTNVLRNRGLMLGRKRILRSLTSLAIRTASSPLVVRLSRKPQHWMQRRIDCSYVRARLLTCSSCLQKQTVSGTTYDPALTFGSRSKAKDEYVPAYVALDGKVCIS